VLISVDWSPAYGVPSGACLALGTRVGRSRLVTPSRVRPNRGRASAPTLERWAFSQSLSGTSLAMAHMKARISRATAVTAMLGCLPREVSRRKRLQSRSWALRLMSWIGRGSGSLASLGGAGYRQAARRPW
jgi:hypothetical protein